MRYLVALLAIMIGLTLSPRAVAQCASNASSCVTCHETQGMRPVLQSVQPWHVDHGFGDLCASCHGGDPAAAVKADAHAAMRAPLADTNASCAGCHAADATSRAARYQAVIASAPPASSSPPSSTPSPPAPSPDATLVNRVLALASAALSLALGLIALRARRVTRRPISAWLRDKTWSPYAAGALLGIIVAFSEVVFGRPLSASGAFDKLAAYVGRALFSSSQYYGHVMSPGITWQVWLVCGVLVGAFASSKLSGEARARWLPDTQWIPRFGSSRMRRMVLAFSGAALVQIGAGIAGGCTSGLAISGGAALAPAAFLFMAGMFAGGIPTAWLWYRGTSAKQEGSAD